MRWFVLRDDSSISYFKSPPAGPNCKPQGHFNLLGATVDAPGETSIEVHAASPARVYYIEAESTASRDRWAAAMSAASRGSSSFDWARASDEPADPRAAAPTIPLELHSAPHYDRWSVGYSTASAVEEQQHEQPDEEEDDGRQAIPPPRTDVQPLRVQAVATASDVMMSIPGLPPGVVVTARAGIDHQRHDRLDWLSRLDHLDALDRAEARTARLAASHLLAL